MERSQEAIYILHPIWLSRSCPREIRVFEVEGKLDEYLAAGVAIVWIVNPDRRTIRVYRNDGTTKIYRGRTAIENEPLLPGFSLEVDGVFPEPSERS